MRDLDRFYAELVRIERSTRVYDELYCSKGSCEVLTRVAPEVFKSIQKALNDEIILSLAKAFDGIGMKDYEYLSQRNIVCRYKDFVSPELSQLREKTSEIWKRLNIRDYRNTILAHNDRGTLIGESPVPVHAVSTDDVLGLLDASRSLIVGLKINIFGGNQTVSVPVNPSFNWSGYGLKFIDKLRKM
jgi:hypothetical protein